MRVVYFIFAVSFLNLAHAGERADRPASFDKQSLDFKVKADGSFTVEENREFTVLTDIGKTALAVQRVQFDPKSMKVKILEAGTITNGRKYPINLNQLKRFTVRQDEGSPGLSIGAEIDIPYDNLKVGSSTYLRYLQEPKNADAQPFSLDFRVAGEAARHTQLHIHSQLELHYQLEDKHAILKVQRKNVNGAYVLNISVKKSIHKYQDQLPRLQVSIASDWREWIRHEQHRYSVADQPLPDVMKQVIGKIPTKVATHQKVEAVLLWLAENYTYSGRWLATNSGWNPRPLSEIASSKTGDCKDYALTLIAMLRGMGIKAEPTYVGMGPTAIIPIDQSHPLVSSDYFNHVVVRYQEGNKWQIVDPGRGVADAMRTPSHLDLAWALNLNSQNETLYQIHIDSKNYAGVKMTTNIEHHFSGGYSVHTYAEFSGELSNFLKQIYFSSGQKTFNSFLENQVSGETKNFHLLKQDVFSRKPGKLRLEYKYNLAEEPSDFDALVYQTHSFLQLSFPLVSLEQIKIKNMYVFDEPKYDCFIRGPVANIDRWVTNTSEGVEINDKVSRPESGKNWDKFSRWQRNRFTTHLEHLQQCQNEKLFLSAKNTKDSKQRSMETSLDLAKPYESKSFEWQDEEGLRREIRKINTYLALQPNDEGLLYWKARRIADLGKRPWDINLPEYFRESNEILTHLILVRPSSARAYGLLGLNSLILKDPIEAMKAFKKGYALDPNNFDVLYLGGKLNFSQKKYEMAIGYFKAAASRAGSTEQKLAALQEQARIESDKLKNTQEAVRTLESAMFLKPLSTEFLNNAASLNIYAGNLKHATELYQKSIDLHPNTRADYGLIVCEITDLEKTFAKGDPATNLSELDNRAELVNEKRQDDVRVLRLLASINEARAQSEKDPSLLEAAHEYQEQIRQLKGKPQRKEPQPTNFDDSADEQLESAEH